MDNVIAKTLTNAQSTRSAQAAYRIAMALAERAMPPGDEHGVTVNREEDPTFSLDQWHTTMDRVQRLDDAFYRLQRFSFSAAKYPEQENDEAQKPFLPDDLYTVLLSGTPADNVMLLYYLANTDERIESWTWDEAGNAVKSFVSVDPTYLMNTLPFLKQQESMSAKLTQRVQDLVLDTEYALHELAYAEWNIRRALDVVVASIDNNTDREEELVLAIERSYKIVISRDFETIIRATDEVATLFFTPSSPCYESAALVPLLIAGARAMQEVIRQVFTYIYMEKAYAHNADLSTHDLPHKTLATLFPPFEDDADAIN